METAVCGSGFLLVVFITGAQLSPDPEIVTGFVGDSAEFHAHFLHYNYMEDPVLYRVSGDKGMPLIHCSQPDRPLRNGYNVKCEDFYDDSKYVFTIHNLALFHSGDYRAEGLISQGILEGRFAYISFQLVVCPDFDEDLSHEYDVKYGDSVALCEAKPEYGSSVQIYRAQLTDERPAEMVLDTKSSLEPLAADLRGRLQVDLSISQVTLSGITGKDFESVFCCMTLRRAQCQIVCSALRLANINVFAHEEERVTLLCISKGEPPGQVHWTTPRVNPMTYQQEVMYKLNGNPTGDYSLIIPAVSRQHSGRYECMGRYLISRISLYVCSKVSISDVSFSHGKTVLLDITEYVKTSWISYGFQWHRQKDLEPQVVLADTMDKVSMPDDLKGRVTVSLSHLNFFLLISNHIAEDSGLYTWRVYGKDNSRNLACLEGSIRLVYRDPFGVDSPFYRAYAPLMGCGLLGLVTAVIWFKLRSRRGEQTSGRQSREGQQSGDEDLYDDVEMAEISG